MRDEVQAPQEETPNTYWRWLVESWRYPLGHNLGEKWYGVVTLLGEDIVLYYADPSCIRFYLLVNRNSVLCSNYYDSLFHGWSLVRVR